MPKKRSRQAPSKPQKGVFSSLRGGFQGFFRSNKRKKKKETTFWDVLFYLLLAFAGAWVLWRWFGR